MKRNNIIVLLITLLSVVNSNLQAQEGITSPQQVAGAIAPPHRIVFQLVSGDTLAHKQLMKQLNNILSVAPGTQMEVVCHGPGLEMLISDKTIVADKIKKLTQSGVVFNACEFSMKERNVEKSRILSEAGLVPAGIIEIVTRQEQGWSYIKSGF
ncbi:MAG TPA: DsrE family protein [Bacteroidia bacterium]|nr:DsrE family protein [Bacteroidia bacterium]